MKRYEDSGELYNEYLLKQSDVETPMNYIRYI